MCIRYLKYVVVILNLSLAHMKVSFILLYKIYSIVGYHDGLSARDYATKCRAMQHLLSDLSQSQLLI